MYALISMAAALVFLVVLLRFKVKLGVSMLLAALGLAILLGVSPAEFGREIAKEWRTRPVSQTSGYLFVTLTALIILLMRLALR